MGEARWFRLDVAWHESKWLAALPWSSRSVWPILIGYVKANGMKGRCRAPIVARMAAGHDIPTECVEECVRAAFDHGAIREDAGFWIVDKWDEYQSPDDSKERVSRFRNKKKQGVTTKKRSGNAVTPSRDTDKDRDIDKNPPQPPKGFDALSLELPPSVSSEIWSSWVKHRKEIKHPLTEETVRKQLAMLAAKSQANAMIEQSIREGWTGIFELKIESKNGKPTMEDARDRAMKAIEGM